MKYNVEDMSTLKHSVSADRKSIWQLSTKAYQNYHDNLKFCLVAKCVKITGTQMSVAIFFIYHPAVGTEKKLIESINFICNIFIERDILFEH